MKKFGKIGIVLCASLVLTLSGCGEKGENTQVNVGNTTASTKVETGETKTDVKVEVGETKTDVKVEAGKDMYGFTHNSVTVYVDADASTVVDKLGEFSYFEAPSCAFNGLDKVYTYSSFEIDTYPDGDKDYISAIIFKDDMIETPEGVTIGMKKEKIEEKYGTPTTKEDTLYVYEKGGMRLRFIFDSEGYVSSIEYMSSKI